MGKPKSKEFKKVWDGTKGKEGCENLECTPFLHSPFFHISQIEGQFTYSEFSIQTKVFSCPSLKSKCNATCDSWLIHPSLHSGQFCWLFWLPIYINIIIHRNRSKKWQTKEDHAFNILIDFMEKCHFSSNP